MWLFRKKTYKSDEELANEYYHTGDRNLIGDLFEKHVKTVFGVCLYYFKDKDMANDAVMQIFEKLIQELRKREIENFKAWLSFVVRNYCISELRKNSVRKFVPESYLDFEVKSTTYEEELKVDSVDEGAMLRYMEACLPLLKDNQRICLKMFYLQNRSYQDISSGLSITLSEVKSHIQNGKRKLKLLIEEKLRTGNNEE